MARDKCRNTVTKVHLCLQKQKIFCRVTLDSVKLYSTISRDGQSPHANHARHARPGSFASFSPVVVYARRVMLSYPFSRTSDERLSWRSRIVRHRERVDRVASARDARSRARRRTASAREIFRRSLSVETRDGGSVGHRSRSQQRPHLIQDLAVNLRRGGHQGLTHILPVHVHAPVSPCARSGHARRDDDTRHEN